MEWSLSGTFSELMATFADGRADVVLKETAPRHTLREGGDSLGENIDVVGDIRALSVGCRPGSSKRVCERPIPVPTNCVRVKRC